MLSTKNKLIAVVGPTASGKSSLAVELALEFNGEVVSADSRQIYKGFNLNAGKITPNETKGIPHHLLDVADPSGEQLTLSEYLKRARAVIKKIQTKNKLPVIAGGTGLYVTSILEGYQVPEVSPDNKLRQRLSVLSLEQLQNSYKSLDPDGFAKIDTNNPRRLIRAIEVVTNTGKPFFQQVKKEKPDFEHLQIGINITWPDLQTKISQRLKERYQQGMLEEVKILHKNGVSWARLESFGLEFKWMSKLAQQQISEQETLLNLEKDILAYAKRQYTWWRKRDVVWVNSVDEAKEKARLFLA